MAGLHGQDDGYLRCGAVSQGFPRENVNPKVNPDWHSRTLGPSSVFLWKRHLHPD